MKPLAILPVLFLLGAGVVACAGNQVAPATPDGEHASNDDAKGATNAQGTENPNRALSKAECDQLGEYISAVCHETHTRQARIEGWCSDIVSRTSSGTWGEQCTKNVKYMDAVCFRSTDNAVAMMSCDRTTAE